MDGTQILQTPKNPARKPPGSPSPLRRGPPSGWVNLRENGRDMLVIDTEGLDFVEDSFPGISFGGGFFGCLTMFCFGVGFSFFN